MLLSLEHLLSASVAEQRASKPKAVTLTSTAEAIKMYGLRQTPVETKLLSSRSFGWLLLGLVRFSSYISFIKFEFVRFFKKS
jgi:hypothetical protein